MPHPPLMQLSIADRGVFLPHSNEDKGVELFYAPSESIFAAVASEMVALGWSLYPQSSEGRYPGRVFQEPIKWAEDHDLKNKLPTEAALKLWKAHCATLNVAVVFGPASSHAFAIDIDCTEPKLADHLASLADEILGYTPFRREGRAPKIALIYRHAATDPVASRAFTLAVDADEKQMLEIQGAGKSLTFHGKHHKTGRYFKWCDDSPMMVGPTAAPLVTSEQVARYVAAVEAAYGFAKGATMTTTGTFVAGSPVAGYKVPVMSQTGIDRGRWHTTNSICFEAVKANVDRIHAAAGEEAAMEAATGAIITAAIASWHHTCVVGGRWSAPYVAKTITANVRSTCLRVQRGSLFPQPPPPKRRPLSPMFRQPPVSRPI